MAEATGRPVAPGAETTNVTSAPRSGPEGLSPQSGPDVYRPLSLRALAGFLLSVLYAVTMLVGAVIALVGGTPLLWSWILLMPIFTAILCWSARRQILASEGTLSGLAFTTWGLGLSVVLGLVYASYYGATYLAVTQQASSLADQFIDHLQKGEIEKAYLLTVPPPERAPADSDLRQALEVRFAGKGLGIMTYTAFRQSDYIRLFRNVGPEATVQPVTVVAWDHDPKGYKVTLRYHLQTIECGADLVVVAEGQEPRGSEDEGRRQWHVIAAETGIGKDSPPQMTEEGLRRMNLATFAKQFAELFTGMMATHRTQEMWLKTLPPAQRDTAQEALDRAEYRLATGTVSGAAFLGAVDRKDLDLRLNYEAFTRGSLLRMGKFWATEKQRPEILRAMRDLFKPNGRFAKVQYAITHVPDWSEDQDKIQVTLDMQALVGNDTGTQPEWSVECRVVVECPPPKDLRNPPQWRIAAMELVSGRTASAGGGQLQRKGGAP
jgi:hypothetical protein